MHPQLHPNLTAPSLFVGHLPNHVRDEQLNAQFQGSSHPDVAVTCTRLKKPRNRKAFHRIDFPDLNSAEKALATLHLQPIPGVDPPVTLKLFTTVGLEPLETPDTASVSPRVIKGLLPGSSAEQALYDTLRPYGPIHSVYIDPIVGGLVQFWNEAHAKEAEVGLIAPGQKRKLVLEAYDPCSLFCSNVSFDLDAAALRAHFSPYGSIKSLEILTQSKSGKSRGLAFVSFALAAQAHAALQAMHGVDIQKRRIAVTYRVLRKDKKSRKKSDGGVAQPSESVSVAASEEVDSKSSPGKDVTEETTTAPEVPSATPPAEADVSGSWNDNTSELQSLRDLYDAEVQERFSVQAENEILRAELEAVKHALELAESRLKMLELEGDRPLWEEAKANRKAAEEAARAKEEARRKAAEVEESRRKMKEFAAQERERKRAAEEAERKERLRREAEEKARKEKEECERLAREKEERERKAREARERREREQRWRSATTTEEARCRDRDNGMWGQGQWTVARALQRLKLQMDEFEKLKFSETQPLTFAVIPWPVLADPLALDVEEVTWSAVEAFFERVRLPAGVEYNVLVERVHRMFHPDKWKARGILASVMDEETRSSLETAGNTVAQAMTPLWRKSKGYA